MLPKNTFSEVAGQIQREHAASREGKKDKSSRQGRNIHRPHRPQRQASTSWLSLECHPPPKIECIRTTASPNDELCPTFVRRRRPRCPIDGTREALLWIGRSTLKWNTQVYPVNGWIRKQLRLGTKLMMMMRLEEGDIFVRAASTKHGLCWQRFLGCWQLCLDIWQRFLDNVWQAVGS